MPGTMNSKFLFNSIQKLYLCFFNYKIKKNIIGQNKNKIQTSGNNDLLCGHMNFNSNHSVFEITKGKLLFPMEFDAIQSSTNRPKDEVNNE